MRAVVTDEIAADDFDPAPAAVALQFRPFAAHLPERGPCPCKRGGRGAQPRGSPGVAPEQKILPRNSCSPTFRQGEINSKASDDKIISHIHPFRTAGFPGASFERSLKCHVETRPEERWVIQKCDLNGLPAARLVKCDWHLRHKPRCSARTRPLDAPPSRR